MRVVVILTGALRTIKKTMRHFKQNVLLPGVEVFACVQNDTAQSDEEWTTWFTEQLGGALKSIQWFAKEKHPAWITHRDLMLQHIHLDNTWKDYLKHSGSMIEYFQLQLAYMKVCLYEQSCGVSYDYLVRARTDTIYVKPVDFHWLSWTEEEVFSRVRAIRTEMELAGFPTDSKNVLKYFMCTLLSDDVIPNLEHIFADYAPCPVEPDSDAIMGRLNEYIQGGRYILTLRKNNLYLVRRDLFHLVPSLGTMYGLMRAPVADEYWFNAECQFRSACYYSCITIFDYSTLFEEKSLEYPHKWEEADFFDLEGNVVNPRMLYCIVRK